VRDPDRGLESVDEIDRIVEPAAGRAGTDEASGDGDSRKSLAGACPADQQEVALLGDQAEAGEVVHEDLHDARKAARLGIGQRLRYA
jgi:hypothetical protein